MTSKVAVLFQTYDAGEAYRKVFDDVIIYVDSTAAIKLPKNNDILKIKRKKSETS